MVDAIDTLLRHRGERMVEYPAGAHWKSLGGRAGVVELIEDLYRRIEHDPLLREVFPHFNSGEAARFFLQWFGGEREYSDGLEGGLLRRHQHRFISPKAAAAWLRCMREALTARGVDAVGADGFMRPLARVAKSMVHSREIPEGELCKSCDAVQEPVQMRLDMLLESAAKGRTADVAAALKSDRTLARRRGLNNRTLAWVAVYRNRPKILELVLNADAEVNAPGCDPLYATLACDTVRMGTGVSVTPLALAKRWHPALVKPLLDRGAIDDAFTAAWLGDLPALRSFLDRHPRLATAIDPADDFQEVSLLCHAVCGGNIACVKLLLECGAEVKRHSGKLLTLATVKNRLDLVSVLLKAGADAGRAGSLGRLDDDERPIADLLIARGKKVPSWMLPRACRPDTGHNELHRVTVLLGYGAKPDDRERHGLTALHYAVRGGKCPLIALLLERGATTDALDDKSLTPLQHLSLTRAKFDPIPVLELLTRHGARVDARDSAGGTLLMHYARTGQAASVRWLLAKGADPHARNANGKTAADLGRAHAEVRRIMAKHHTTG